MAEPFLSEIRMWGFGWPPRGWLQCDGQILPISQYQSLFALLGTSFGGDGRSTFGIPDMRGRAPVHKKENGGVKIGEMQGVENVTLTEPQMGEHSHTVKATTSNANVNTFTSNIFAAGFQNVGRPAKHVPRDMYGAATNLVSLNAESISTNGTGGSHNNMQPFNVVNFCIAVTGIFPSRN